MELNIGPRGILQIDDARIVFRNFSGREDKFNREGARNFAVVIPTEEMANDLKIDGWNVKIKPPRDEDDTPFMFLTVKVKFNDRGPKVYLRSGDNVNELDEETVGILDNIDIASVDMDIRPYDSVVRGEEYRTAYLQSICVTQEVDRFAARYSKSAVEETEDEDNDLPF